MSTKKLSDLFPKSKQTIRDNLAEYISNSVNTSELAKNLMGRLWSQEKEDFLEEILKEFELTSDSFFNLNGVQQKIKIDRATQNIIILLNKPAILLFT